MSKLVLLRHGESLWNRGDLFTGWVDVPLSLNGIEEALKAGEKLKDFCFDKVYTSLLFRSIETAMIVLAKSKCGQTPVIQHEQGKMKEWAMIENKDIHVLPVFPREALNERFYGKLQGLNKKKTAKIYGEKTVQKWRRSYSVKPPGGESLEMTAKRTIPFFKGTIIPELELNNNVLISAHGNSLRSIIMYIERLSEEEIVHVEMPTGTPILYEYKDAKFTDKTTL